jgi:GTPase
MADASLFLIDARAGVTANDRVFAEILRRSGRPVILAANKAEGRAADAGLIEAWELGLGEPLALSAEHGEGMAELAARLAPMVEAAEEAADLPETDVDVTGEEGEDDAPRAITADRPLRIAVIGRPNAGKSTLINRILGEERLLTGPEAGITRDAIAVPWTGTARRCASSTPPECGGSRHQDKLEKMSVADGLRAVKFAEVVVVLLDAAIPFETQDLRIADLAEREGRAVVVAVNKWDLEDEKQEKLKALRDGFETLLPQLRARR